MLNSVQLIGHLGKAPEIRVINNTTLAYLSIGSNRTWFSDGEETKTVTWVDVVAFNGLAKSLACLSKGDQVAVSGRLNNKTDRDGKIRGLEVVAGQIDFLKVKAWSEGEAA